MHVIKHLKEESQIEKYNILKDGDDKIVFTLAELLKYLQEHKIYDKEKKSTYFFFKKKGGKDDQKIIRPISLHPVFCKLFA